MQLTLPIKQRRLKVSLSCMLVLFALAACKKFVTIPSPADRLDRNAVFASDAAATSALMGIYSDMTSNSQVFTTALTTLYTGLAADELTYYSPAFQDEFVKNELSETVHPVLASYFWSPAYRFIYATNSAIEQLERSATLTPSVKRTLVGEAKYIRSFCYFYLVNLFGDVPLILNTHYATNASLGRTPSAQVYQQIIVDLKDAQALLPASYATADRARVNKWAATSLLARVYLYQGRWLEAEQESNAVIQSGAYSLAVDPTKVFLKNSPETIWQLVHGNALISTYEAISLLPATSASTPTYLVTDSLISAFETADLRKAAWVVTRTFASQQVAYPTKYKHLSNGSTVTEHYVVSRLTELYLIRAEARMKLNRLADALLDLNLVRSRAGLPNQSSSDAAALSRLIEKERRIELFAEWGHRWFDLKRTSRATPVLGPRKPTWQPTDALWPIPQSEINLNPALVQNPGY